MGPVLRFLGEGPNGVSIKSLRVSATGRPLEGEGFSLSHALSQTHKTEYGGRRWNHLVLSLAVFCQSKILLVKVRRTLLQKSHDAFLVACRIHLCVLRGLLPRELFIELP